jgi:outer membrane beta-barrel protein
MMAWRASIMVVLAVALSAPAAVRAEESAPLGMDESPVIAPPSKDHPLQDARIDTERFEVGPYYGLYAPDSFGVSSIVGVRLAYHVTEDIAFEAGYAMGQVDQTSFRRLTGRSLLANENLSYWNVGASYELFPGQIFLTRKRTINSAIYLIGGLGQTTMDDRGHFTVDFGTGFKLFATDWLNIRPDLRIHVFETDLTGEKTLTYNIEATLAVAVFF